MTDIVRSDVDELLPLRAVKLAIPEAVTYRPVPAAGSAPER